MRKASSIVVAMNVAIALYFTLFWGGDALRVLTSPTYGLEDVWRSQFIFGIGHMFGLSPVGLIKLAAFFGIMKLAAAIVFAVHIVDRCRRLVGRKPNPEIFESGLILVVLITLAATAPAVWSFNSDLLRDQTVQLLLAGLAAALVVIERSNADLTEIAGSMAESGAAAPRQPRGFVP
jgi:hypothetical protein